MYPRAHKHCTLITHALHPHLITQALHPHHTSTARSSWFPIGVGWGGVGWDNNVHVPARTQAVHTHHTSTAPSPHHTSTAPSPHHTSTAPSPHHTSTAPSSYKHCTFIMVPYCCVVGWGGVKTFMYPRAHKHCTFMMNRSNEITIWLYKRTIPVRILDVTWFKLAKFWWYQDLSKKKRMGFVFRPCDRALLSSRDIFRIWKLEASITSEIPGYWQKCSSSNKSDWRDQFIASQLRLMMWWTDISHIFPRMANPGNS